MNITFTIPDKFVPPSMNGVDFSREVLEAYAIERYRREELSFGQVAEMLDLSVDEAHAFLKEHNVKQNYDEEDLARDRRTIEMFLKK